MLLCLAQELWTKREKPVALDLDAVMADGGNGTAAEANGTAAAHSNGAAGELGVSACKALGLTDQHRVWSVRESAQVTGPAAPATLMTHAWGENARLALPHATSHSNLMARQWLAVGEHSINHCRVVGHLWVAIGWHPRTCTAGKRRLQVVS